MDTEQIRKKWYEFFQKRGHKVIPSSSLVPHGDPTLLFTSAGMVQFKPYFMGQAEPPSRRMVTIQKCFRTSDIDSVGDATHLTFFEMLGNFSVGDYFKKESIEWAWELLTDPKEGIALDKDRLWVSVYLDDDEAAGHWRALGVPEDRIMRYGEEENYWFSGDVGPCGPCSEIHYDRGKTPSCPECAKDTCHPQIDCGRFTELWNLVFTMYYQNEDGSRTDLPQKNIDTGAGLERWASVLQGTPTVYETDLFRPIIARIEDMSGFGPKWDGERTGMGGEHLTSGGGVEVGRSKKIIAEHARAVTFLIADGVMPSKEKRGYVLRRILRRAVAYGRRLGLHRPFLTEIVREVIEQYGSDYRELLDNKAFIENVVGVEEKQFMETLERGRVQLAVFLADRVMDGKALAGKHVFLLSDTYGFPVELTAEFAAEQGVEIAWEEFEREMEAQRERARAASQFGLRDQIGLVDQVTVSLARPFVGYDTLRHETTIAGIIADGRAVEGAETGDQVEVVLHETPFYAESGGQVGDTGEISSPSGRFQVQDTQRTEGGLILHRGRVVEGRIAVNDDVVAQVDAGKRHDTARNHTATHLLHAALRKVLGPHARQAGSLVSPERLRFDFIHIEALKPDELAAVQRLANEKVRENLPVSTRRSSYEEATAGGAMALFDEKYAAEVRVVEVMQEADERYSAELCGGTHVQSTGEIGSLIVVSEESVGAGMRRIEAVTGRGAEEYVRERLSTLQQLRGHLGVTGDDAELVPRVDSLFEEVDSLKKRVQALEREIGRDWAESLLADAEQVDGHFVLVARVPANTPDGLLDMADWLTDRLGSAVVLLATGEGHSHVVVMASKDLADRGFDSTDVLNAAVSPMGGRGGGKPRLARGAGRDVSRLDEALRVAKELAAEKIRGLKES